MKTLSPAWALHPTRTLHSKRWWVVSIVATGVAMCVVGAMVYTLAANGIAPIVGAVALAIGMGVSAYLATRSLRAANLDLQQQLAERSDALN